MIALMRILALAAAGPASLALVAVATPASACDTASPTDISCGPANVDPVNAPRRGEGAPASGSTHVVGASLGADAPATVTPDDGYAPEDAAILHRRHHHRRTRAE